MRSTAYVQPFLAYSYATHSPIPELAPVITTTVPTQKWDRARANFRMRTKKCLALRSWRIWLSELRCFCWRIHIWLGGTSESDESKRFLVIPVLSIFSRCNKQLDIWHLPRIMEKIFSRCSKSRKVCYCRFFTFAIPSRRCETLR